MYSRRSHRPGASTFYSIICSTVRYPLLLLRGLPRKRHAARDSPGNEFLGEAWEESDWDFSRAP
jgi:hypothetical protein